MNQFASKLWRILLESAWIFWLGGTTFYIAIVVPVGGEILGASTQGEVTQSVTWYMNLAGLVAISVWGVEHWRRGAWIGFQVAVALLLLQWILIYLRHVLVLDALSNTPWPWEAWSFYTMHRIYLWVTTLQWLIAIAATFVASYRKEPWPVS